MGPDRSSSNTGGTCRFVFRPFVLVHNWASHVPLLQAKEVKEVADYVAQLRRIGKGHGVFHFDQVMAEDASRLATPSSQYGA